MNNEMTNGNTPEFTEAIRLINKFIPESKAHIHKESGISLKQMIAYVPLEDFKSDFSCYHFVLPEDPDLGLRKKGGFEGENDEIYFRLIKHTGFSPRGRAVVVPDVRVKGECSSEDMKPFVCAVETLPSRLNELDHFFDESFDRLIVFETGEVICIDHDLRVFWGASH